MLKDGIIRESLLLLLLEKTKLSGSYSWIFSPHKLSDFYSWVFLLPRPKISNAYGWISSLQRPKLPSRIKTLPSETKLYAKTWFSNFGKPKIQNKFEDRTNRPKR